MKKQEKFDRPAYARRRRREELWATWRETALFGGFIVLLMVAAGVGVQWWMA